MCVRSDKFFSLVALKPLLLVFSFFFSKRNVRRSFRENGHELGKKYVFWAALKAVTMENSASDLCTSAGFYARRRFLQVSKSFPLPLSLYAAAFICSFIRVPTLSVLFYDLTWRQPALVQVLGRSISSSFYYVGRYSNANLRIFISNRI